MKKVAILCMDADRRGTIEALREIGVLHLERVAPPRGADLDEAKAKMTRAEAALGLLEKHAPSAHEPAPRGSTDEIIDRVNELAFRKRALVEKTESLANEKKAQAPFGDFDPGLLRKLAQKGIKVKLCHAVGKDAVAAPKGAFVRMIGGDSTGRYFVMAGLAEFECNARECKIPERSLSDIVNEMARTAREMEDMENELGALAGAIPRVRNRAEELREQTACIEAREGMGVSGKIAYIRGFCPADQIHKLRSAAKTHGWGLIEREPSGQDAVPTLIRYPAWVRMMRPIFAFLGITPGYREADISSAFFAFLTVFFAMIIGDAGYGLLFLILTPWVRKKKFPDAPPDMFRLLYVFSVSTIILGMLTGNYFGIDYEFLPPPFKSLRIDWLIEQGNSMTLALLLGAVHLTVAHIWKAIRFGRGIKAVIEFGWVCVIWGAFGLARYLLVGADFPVWLAPSSVAGALAILIGLALMKQWTDLGMLVLSFVSCFGDLMSYLRLFALGISGVKVAEAFNGMAGDLGAMLIGMAGAGAPLWLGVILAAAGMAFVLVVGHGLNIVLCAMSVLVHGVRLNALEFSLHLGQEWSGFPYRPFARRTAKSFA